MKVAANLTIALALIALPASILAQGSDNSQNMTPHLVATQGSLVQTIDAKKAQIGSEFKVKLNKSVRLDNGKDLPAGTLLVGNIVADDTQANGQAKVALRFTHAQLKDGSSVAIRATIVGVASSADASVDWNPAISSVDRVNVVSNVDLHSKVGAQNSGVFVSTKKDDVKIDGGSQIILAITGGGGA